MDCKTSTTPDSTSGQNFSDPPYMGRAGKTEVNRQIYHACAPVQRRQSVLAREQALLSFLGNQY